MTSLSPDADGSPAPGLAGGCGRIAGRIAILAAAIGRVYRTGHDRSPGGGTPRPPCPGPGMIGLDGSNRPTGRWFMIEAVVFDLDGGVVGSRPGGGPGGRPGGGGAGGALVPGGR